MKGTNGHLTLTRKKDEKYYLFFTGTREYSEVIQGDINSWEYTDEESDKGHMTLLSDSHIRSKHIIKATQGIQIVREELLERVGGLENAIQISNSGQQILKREGKH